MRTFLAAATLVIAAVAAADDGPKPLSVSIETLGDRDALVVARIFFRFANPRSVTEAGLFLEGSITEGGGVPRNFRFAVPRKGDKFVWNNYTMHNGKVIRHTRWAVLPDLRNEMAMDHAFAVGAAEIEARLILEKDYGGTPQVVAAAAETFTLAKTNRALPEDEAEEPEPAPPGTGPLTIREPSRIAGTNRVKLTVDAAPPIQRVEFRIGDRTILARRAPPYTADLELPDATIPTALHAIGYDPSGRYIDAAAVVVNEPEPHPGVTITRTTTPDGLTHFALTVRNTRAKSAALYAGGKKLAEWSAPPFTTSIPTASLAGVDVVRATVVEEGGREVSDAVTATVRRYVARGRRAGR